jgi:hypothetical protein
MLQFCEFCWGLNQIGSANGVQLERACLENMTKMAATEQEAALLQLQDLAHKLAGPQMHPEYLARPAPQNVATAEAPEPHSSLLEQQLQEWCPRSKMCPTSSQGEQHGSGDTDLDMPQATRQAAAATTCRSQRLASKPRASTRAAARNERACSGRRKRQRNVSAATEAGGATQHGPDCASGGVHDFWGGGFSNSECNMLLELCDLGPDTLSSAADVDGLRSLCFDAAWCGEHLPIECGQASVLDSSGVRPTCSGTSNVVCRNGNGVRADVDGSLEEDLRGAATFDIDGARMQQAPQTGRCEGSVADEYKEVVEGQPGGGVENSDAKHDTGLRGDEVDIDADTLALFATMDGIVHR